MNKKVIGVVAAGFMALIGTGILVMYVRGAEDRALAGERLVTVLQANQTIPAGTPVGEIQGLIEPEEIPEKIAPEGILTDLVQVSGQVTASEILAGETLLAGRFVAAEGFSASRPGSVEIEEGLLEVTIAMSQEQFVGGVPVPGDRVAVIANGTRADFIPFLADPLQSATVPDNPEAVTGGGGELSITKIVIQQALVTNVQGNPLPASPVAQSATERVAPADGSLLVTLALDGPDTERLLYVRDGQTLNANLHMAVHNGDAPVTTEGISVENIINREAPIG